MVARGGARRLLGLRRGHGAARRGVLARADAAQRILITADKGFGEKVYRLSQAHRGVILLRLDDETPPSKIAALRRALDRYGDGLAESYAVITETTMRLAR